MLLGGFIAHIVIVLIVIVIVVHFDTVDINILDIFSAHDIVVVATTNAIVSKLPSTIQTTIQSTIQGIIKTIIITAYT